MSKESISPLVAEMIQNGEAVTADQYKSALVSQEQYCNDTDNLLKHYDFVVFLAT